MPGRGPRPTPKEVLRRRGSWRGNSNHTEVRPPPERPRRPNWLDDIGRYAWEQAVKHIEDMGLIARMDANAIARYASLYSEWRKAAAFIDKHGQAYPTYGADGKPNGFYAYPQVKFYMALGDALLRLEHEFGMTPASRANLRGPERQPEPASGRVPMQAPLL